MVTLPYARKNENSTRCAKPTVLLYLDMMAHFFSNDLSSNPPPNTYKQLKFWALMMTVIILNGWEATVTGGLRNGAPFQFENGDCNCIKSTPFFTPFQDQLYCTKYNEKGGAFFYRLKPRFANLLFGNGDENFSN